MDDRVPRDHESACWAEYEDAIGPPPGAAARIRARVDRVIARRDDAEPRVDTVAEERVPRAAAVILMMKSSAMSIAIAFAALGSLHLGARAIAPTPAELPARVETPQEDPRPAIEVPPPIEVASIPTTTTVPEPPPVPETSPPPITRPRASAPTPAPTATSVTDALAEETALIARANAAMDRKAYTDALRLFADHAQRFPGGVLVPEREAFTAIARCRSGARGSILATFTTAHPRSPYLERVREACGNSSTDRSTPTE